MELLIGIAIIFVLLLCLGVSTEVIVQIAIGIICLFVVFMAGVFIYATIILLSGKKKKGVFLRSDNEDKGKLPYARYLIEGTEYVNLFPLEVIFQSKIYRTDREVNLILNEKAKKCMDGNAVMCCILGLAVSVFLIVWICLFAFGKI